jgi:hypothetical protein
MFLTLAAARPLFESSLSSRMRFDRIPTARPARPQCRSPESDAGELTTRIDDYIQATESVSMGGTDDVEAFLAWVDEEASHGGAMAEAVATVARPQAVERLALRQQLALARFERLSRTNSGSLAAESPRSRRCVVLNPSHVWANCESREALADDVPGPTTVLLYEVDGDSRTLLVRPALEPLLRRLSQSGPQTLRSLTARAPGWSREVVHAALSELEDRGVIAAVN